MHSQRLIYVHSQWKSQTQEQLAYNSESWCSELWEVNLYEYRNNFIMSNTCMVLRSYSAGNRSTKYPATVPKHTVAILIEHTIICSGVEIV